jgi:autotransporter translocation and assembly factor TamB
LDDLRRLPESIWLARYQPGLDRKRDRRVDRLLVTGPETRIEVSGTAGLAAPGPLNLRLVGNMDLALAAFFSKDIQAGGDSRFELALSGTRQDPRADGFFQVDGGQVAMDEPAIQLTDLALRLDLARNEITISRLNGSLNGGTLTGSGRVTYPPTGPAQVNVDLSADNVFMEAIEGLRTAANADIQVRSDRRGFITIGGRVDVLQGSFTENLNVEEELLGIVASEEELGLIQERSPLLERVRFNVAVHTQEPVIVDNNLAELAMDMNVRLAGTYYRPGLVGRLNLEDGGEIYLRERTYYLERGLISFNNTSRIEPGLDLTARTQAKDAGVPIDITLRISGTPDDMETTLTSDPPLPEPDIIAILVTGRRLEEARGQASAVVREQTLSLLAGGVAGRIGTGLDRRLD